MLFHYIHLGNLRAAVQHSPQARRAGEGPAALSPAGPACPQGKPVSSTRLLLLPHFPKLLRNKTAAGAGRAFPGLSALLMLAQQAPFNPIDASTHIFGGPGSTCHLGGEISIMQMGYFTFADYLIQVLVALVGVRFSSSPNSWSCTSGGGRRPQCRTPGTACGENC